MTATAAPEGQRIDKWLWHARFARTRTAAQQLALAGHVRVNRDKVKVASRLVRPGDVLTLSLRAGVAVIRIRGLAERRASADEARQLYEPAAVHGKADREKGVLTPHRPAALRSLKRPGKPHTRCLRPTGA